uniref:Uncharacterized protein LOC111113494 n=1 Tax=Crassostrea virginica TaxID=6565 RepID=A0A8B8BVU8_CRAVI|nr:uncharacterized protein LOC111113494 [Crassostrea virginica]
MFTLCLFVGWVTSSFSYDNLALNKPTHQDNEFIGDISRHLTESSNAVDGLKSDLGVWGGQCVISGNKKQNATLWVNLSSIVSIHHITIYYRTGNEKWGKLTMRVLCFKDTNFTNSTIPDVFNVTCPIHGQYVIYYNERLPSVTYPDGYSTYAYNELCELEVYGCSDPGYYGSNCSTSCPDPHCRYCHIETGTCQGCHEGYRGHHCEIAVDVLDVTPQMVRVTRDVFQVGRATTVLKLATYEDMDKDATLFAENA